MIRSYRDLVVWQRAMALAEGVYLLTRDFPREEQFGLTSQSRRAAVSVAANIAEGHGRGTRQSYASFLRIARGSLKELEPTSSSQRGWASFVKLKVRAC